MHEARALYHQWGADAKVSHLESRYPQWFKTETVLTGTPDTPAGAGKVRSTITQSTTPIQLDLESITSASQILAAETKLDQLCTKMMSLVMANSGAEKAVLLLKGENEWFVQARKDITTDEPTALFYQPFDPTDRETELIPESVFNYCTRTKDVLVLGDAQLDQRFAEDRMIQKYKIRSIACLPALSQGELKAMLYLENRQTADVFSSENVGLLKHLSAQFAISVENTFLYNNLNQLVEERTAQLQQEVTERKRTESELQAQINLVDTLLTTARDTIEVFDPDTLAYIKWNKACTDVTGYSDEEFATMNPATSFFDEADARRVEAGIDQVMKVGHTIVTADLIAFDCQRRAANSYGIFGLIVKGRRWQPTIFYFHRPRHHRAQESCGSTAGIRRKVPRHSRKGQRCDLCS
jgi:GAF domain-containing protein